MACDIRVTAADLEGRKQGGRTVDPPPPIGESVAGWDLLACFQANATARNSRALPCRFFRTIHVVGTTGKPNKLRRVHAGGDLGSGKPRVFSWPCQLSDSHLVPAFLNDFLAVTTACEAAMTKQVLKDSYHKLVRRAGRLQISLLSVLALAITVTGYVCLANGPFDGSYFRTRSFRPDEALGVLLLDKLRNFATRWN